MARKADRQLRFGEKVCCRRHDWAGLLDHQPSRWSKAPNGTAYRDARDHDDRDLPSLWLCCGRKFASPTSRNRPEPRRSPMRALSLITLLLLSASVQSAFATPISDRMPSRARSRRATTDFQDGAGTDRGMFGRRRRHRLRGQDQRERRVRDRRRACRGQRLTAQSLGRTPSV